MRAARVSVEALNDLFTTKLTPDDLSLVLDGVRKLSEGEDVHITRL